MTTKQSIINEAFYSWLKNTFPPICLILSSSNAQKILDKNCLSPSQFMRPFGDLKDTSLKFSFGDKYLHTIKDFKLDFYEPQDFVKKELNQINNYIINCLGTESVMPNFDKNFIKLSKDNIKEFILQLNHFSPYYYCEFEKLYFELCRFQETELYQQPVLNIFLCDINDNINIIDKLLGENLPKLIVNEAYEQRILALVILLNDKSNLSKKNFNKLILENNFKNKYNGRDIDIFTIDINSGCLNENQNDISDDIWSNYIHKVEEYSDGFEPIRRGKYITNEEVKICKQQFKDYIKDKFRPSLIELINNIDKMVSKNSGINSLFNKFKGNKSDKQEIIQGYNIPKLSFNEKQRYFIAILLFHIRDYFDAYEYLKKLKDSIKGKSRDYDNAIRQFLLICRYMKKEDKSKINILDTFQLYMDNKQYILAFRNILLYLKMTEQIRTNNIIESIYKYNYNLSNPVVKYFSGLVYEKIGFYHLLSEHPKIRKFALNTLCYSAQQYILEKEEDIKNNYLIQNLGYVCDLFKIDYDYSKYDNDIEINTFSFIKKYILNYLCSACDVTNNIKFGIPVFINYLRLILLELNDNLLIAKKQNLFDFMVTDDIKEIEYYFQRLNAIFIKGKIPFLDNFPLPIIEDESLIFYIEQDQKILKENSKINLDFVKSFKKYLELSIEQKYSVLSEDDISCLRFIDEQSSRNFISNYFMKTINNVKVGEKIFIKFNINNPLNINLPIKNMTLIINKKEMGNCLTNKTNNENEYDCGSYEVELPSKTMYAMGIIVTFNSPGIFEISGLTMTLFKNINVRYFFNKKTINTLYLKKNKENNYTQFVKSNFCFNVIEAIKSISINVNNGNNKMLLFQNQMKYLSIKINNNNNEVEIRKYTIFLGTDDDILLYPKYLHKNYLTPNNTILIPIIGLKVGETKIKIIIKYEEKTNKPILDLYRNVISVKVYKGINLNIEDHLYEYNKSVNRRLIKLNMDVIQKMNIHSISFSKSKSIIINKEKFMIEEFHEDDNEMIINDIQDKNINQKILIRLLNKDKKEEFNTDQLLDEIIGSKKKEDHNNYPHIKDFFREKFCNENNLILKYKLNLMDNNGVNSVNCIYKHEIKIKQIPFMKAFYVDNIYLKNNLIKYFSINYEAEDFDEEQKYITININLLNNNENFEKIGNNIEYIEIKVDEGDNNFEWMGLYSTKFKDILAINNEEKTKVFNCIIGKKSCSLSDKKNEINLNHFIFLVKIKNSNTIYQYTEFPYALYYSKSLI